MRCLSTIVPVFQVPSSASSSRQHDMAAADPFRRTSDDVSISLLRGLRSGSVDIISFVHRIDVCSAAPEDLVANLDPVPGTELGQGGYNAIWFFYCPKRFKNVQGKPSGHRHRAIAGGDTCWHSETRPKPVKGLDGATFCNLSYGRKEEGSGRLFNRMGWCMIEYDDDQGGEADHVLCKIYRSSSSLAKRKLKPTTQGLSGSKRKAAVDHAQYTPPATKMSHYACTDQELYYVDHPQVQQQPCFQQMTMPGCVDYQTVFPAEEVQIQQNTPQPDQLNIESLFPAQWGPDWEQILQYPSQDNTVCSCSPTPMAPPGAGFSQGLAF
ncbi:unnamed protein product [Urochloa humidicola]